MNKEGVYKTNIHKFKQEDVLCFNNPTYPSKAFISSDCKRIITSDLSVINFWVIGEDYIVKIIPRQTFLTISVSFDNKVLIIMDNISRLC